MIISRGNCGQIYHFWQSVIFSRHLLKLGTHLLKMGMPMTGGLSGERAAGHRGPDLVQNSLDFFRFVFINIEKGIFECENVINFVP